MLYVNFSALWDPVIELIRWAWVTGWAPFLCPPSLFPFFMFSFVLSFFPLPSLFLIPLHLSYPSPSCVMWVTSDVAGEPGPCLTMQGRVSGWWAMGCKACALLLEPYSSLFTAPKEVLGDALPEDFRVVWPFALTDTSLLCVQRNSSLWHWTWSLGSCLSVMLHQLYSWILAQLHSSGDL